MMQRVRRLAQGVRRSASAFGELFCRRPLYIALALGVGLVFYQVIFWFLNLGLAQYLFTTPYLSLLDKLSLVWGSFAGVFAPPLSMLGLLLLGVSLLQGIAIAGLVYSFRSNRQQQSGSASALGGVGAAGLLSVLGLGCAACGTSLITPLLALFTASASTALADQIGLYSVAAALLLTLVSLYVIGKRLYINLSLDRRGVVA